MLARSSHLTRWSGRIVAGMLLGLGVWLLR
jgi:hypothetical protein